LNQSHRAAHPAAPLSASRPLPTRQAHADQPSRAALRAATGPAVDADSFTALGLCDPVLAALADEGYEVPTPIQARAIPHVLAGRDLFGCAQTGTGKTAAFALPIITRMHAAPRPKVARQCRVLVLAPTRELAAQIHASFRAYGRHMGVTTAVVHGGVSQRPQEDAMRRGVDVLVATPGRLLDLIAQRHIDLRAAEWLVLDEADRMLDMGFIHDVRRIVALVPADRQTLFFSATLPREVRDLAGMMLRDPLEVQAAPQSTPAETVSQSVHFVAKREKKALLVELLEACPTGRVIVFTRTKHGADKLHRDLAKAGITAAAIHGNKSQGQRERALAAFKSPRPPVLIATDIAARGLDVDDVSHVINYELPHEPETYVHRIGRTGRAGQTGAAVAFCDPEERPRLTAIEDLLGRAIPRRNEPTAAGPVPAGDDRGGRGRRGGQDERRGGQGGRRRGGEADRSGASSGRPRSRGGRQRDTGDRAGGTVVTPRAVSAAAGEHVVTPRTESAAPTAERRPAATPAGAGGRRRHRRAL
jgi:ATP-dependent RNA helicase RhlE